MNTFSNHILDTIISEVNSINEKVKGLNYLEILKTYDQIIYTRFDQFYLTKHYKGIKGKILIPEGEDYFGICDRHALFPSELAEEFLSICSFIDSDDAFAPVILFSGWPINSCVTSVMLPLTPPFKFTVGSKLAFPIVALLFAFSISRSSYNKNSTYLF